MEAADSLTSPSAGTVQIDAGGGSQGMEPMQPPAALDIGSMDRPTGDRR
jgi:hypothetical protein